MQQILSNTWLNSVQFGWFWFGLIRVGMVCLALAGLVLLGFTTNVFFFFSDGTE